MIRKTYRSGCDLVLAIATTKTPKMRIRFQQSGQFYFFATDDEEIQNGLEKGCDFNISYELIKTEDLSNVPEPAAEETAEAEEEKTLLEVNVSSIADAKEYLAEQFGYARSNLRSKAAIIKAGEEHGVTFVGI